MPGSEQHRFRWLWVLAGAVTVGYGALTFGAFAVGWLFAAVAVPFYCWSCSNDHNPIAMLTHPGISPQDYLHFLAAGQCSPHAQSNEVDSDSYLDLSSFWGDDAVSNLFSNVAALAVRSFKHGVIEGAQTITSWLDNHAIAGLYALTYVVITLILAGLLTHFARDLYELIKRKVASRKTQG